jgi:hypothetical protein
MLVVPVTGSICVPVYYPRMLRSPLHWIQETRRRPFALRSPLPPATVIDRLNQNLTKETNFSKGYIGKVGPFSDGSQSWPVRLSFRGLTYSSWRFIFKGSVGADDAGTLLTGTLGPIEFVFFFSLVWLGGVTAFFLGGCIGIVSEIANGHGVAYLPLMLIPLAMIALFFVLTGLATTKARSDWRRMEKWLTELLDLRDQSPPGPTKPEL